MSLMISERAGPHHVPPQVDLYALSALELLLPAVLTGTTHANWRIRQSSIELLGDLLFKVGEKTLRP